MTFFDGASSLPRLDGGNCNLRSVNSPFRSKEADARTSTGSEVKMNRRSSKFPVRLNTLAGTEAVRELKGNVIFRNLNELSRARLNGILFVADCALILVKSSLRRVKASA